MNNTLIIINDYSILAVKSWQLTQSLIQTLIARISC
nr:MAG TPA: hypothetical protein [Caudoviricetes sp.]